MAKYKKATKKANDGNRNYSSDDNKTELRKVRLDDLIVFDPLTDTQESVYDNFSSSHLLLHGLAGTGKTFLSLYKALEEVLDPSSIYKKLVIVRSTVATREIGFLKGDDKQKISVFEAPYIAICEELFGIAEAYEALKAQGSIEFISTSFIRGGTMNNSIMLIDEMENLNFHELDSLITRVGRHSKIIFCGDYKQSDFKYDDEKAGIVKFLQIVEQLKNFTIVNFGWEDIVRSDFVRDYIMTKEMLGY
mgnify:CR=1 FL=1